MQSKKPLIFTALGMCAGATAVIFSSLFMTFPSTTDIVQNAPLGRTSSPNNTSNTAATSNTSDQSKRDALPIISNTHSSEPAVSENTPALPSTSREDPLHPVTEKPTPPLSHTIEISHGDTLMGALVGAGIETGEALLAVRSLRDLYDPRSLKAGDKITVTFDYDATEGVSFQRLSLEPEPDIKILSSRDKEGHFSSSTIKIPLREEVFRIEGRIGSSLFADASRAGIPIDAIQRVIDVFSYDVDFQRDIQQGDRFFILLSRRTTPEGEFVGQSTVLYTGMTLSGKSSDFWMYKDKNGRVGYYNRHGESARKALLKTPVNGARLTSRFGRRVHPILGYSRLHKGVDFAAARGTPIYAAGDGKVERAGRNGGYGKYVRLRHSNGYATAYAHMSRIAKGLRPGKRVQQGDVIGYVGSTGRSTGPHLHYEILRKGVQINPLAVKFPTGKKLAGTELKHFQNNLTQIEETYASLPVMTKRTLASAE